MGTSIECTASMSILREERNVREKWETASETDKTITQIIASTIKEHQEGSTTEVLLVGLHRELDRGNKLSASSSNTM